MRYLTYLFLFIVFFSISCEGDSKTKDQAKKSADAQTSQQASDVETMLLIPMMRLLLSDMYKVNDVIYTENYKRIEQGARSIADHPAMTEIDKNLVKFALGKEIKRFVKFDMVVHHQADSMAKAAQQNKMNEVLRHYNIVQRGCVDCHSNYRTKIIEIRKMQDEKQQ
jgi:uncharacterized membrane protein